MDTRHGRNHILSFGKIMLHELARVVLLEQLSRIHNPEGHPYHGGHWRVDSG